GNLPAAEVLQIRSPLKHSTSSVVKLSNSKRSLREPNSKRKTRRLEKKKSQSPTKPPKTKKRSPPRNPLSICKSSPIFARLCSARTSFSTWIERKVQAQSR